ncbi:MAG: hypothetical protein J5693_05080 [Bacteroidales bacterium]|nr:hypothetical protein [Bacteroidales bacterium]
MKRLFTALVIALCLMLSSCQACVREREPRMDRTRLNIGAYILQPYARSEAHIKDLADCGIDFVICIDNDRGALNLLEKYGVGAIVTGVVPGWWGGNGEAAGSLEKVNPMQKYEEAAASFEDHPAIWGIDIGDEPSALDFPYYGKVLERVEELFPKQFAFLNLYPNYASVAQNTEDEALSQLGTATYEEHIEQYCRFVHTDYLSYDFYYKVAGIQKDYANLRVVADACHKNGLDMWVTVQVNSLDPDVWISENELRFQAFSALAFGATNLSWACYTAGWWNNQVLDGEGNKTQQYDKLKRVNAEIHTLAERYMKYANIETVCVGFDGTDMLDDSGIESQSAVDFGPLSGLSAGCPLVAGKMAGRNGSRSKALFICVADDPYDEHPESHTIRFAAKGCKVKAWSGNGPIEVKRCGEGLCEMPVVSNQGVLLEF